MRWIDNSQTNFRAFPWIKSGTGITCLALAAFLITSLAMQGPGVTCHDPSVVTLAEHDFVMIKVDVTKGGNPMHERLLEQYKVKGVPPLVFLIPMARKCWICVWWIIFRPIIFLAAWQRLRKVTIKEMGKMLKVSFFLNEHNGKP